jgi:transcriptional regulator with XRE-family HTH domain
VDDILVRLGQNIRLARKRRRISVDSLAASMFITAPTLRKVEKGDPTVSFSAVVSALWTLGLADDLMNVANPDLDAVGLEAERKRLPARKRRKAKDDDEFG